MDYRIVHVADHYELLINEEFYCSADTMFEALIELDNYRKEETND